MGDIAKKNVKKRSLEERVGDRESRRKEIRKENDTIAYISGEKKTEAEIISQYQKSNMPLREKAISARVNGELYEKFKDICKKNNMTTNAGINMLIAEYVKNNE